MANSCHASPNPFSLQAVPHYTFYASHEGHFVTIDGLISADPWGKTSIDLTKLDTTKDYDIEIAIVAYLPNVNVPV